MHHAAHARGWAHRIANFRGLRARTGKRKKHTMKHVAAPRLQAVKARRRSQRDTTDEGGVVRIVGYEGELHGGCRCAR